MVQRRACMIVALLVVIVGIAHAELPKTLEEFQARVVAEASDPQKAVKLFFDGIFIYLSGEKDLGKLCIMEMSRYKEWNESQHRMLMERMRTQPYIYRSYAEGATPQNKYEMNPQDYKLVFSGEPNMKPFDDKPQGDYCKLFVKSGGADSPRPITLQRNSAGQYKVYDFSSINLGVRPPASAADGNF
jgi:hypothetical protein